MATCGVGGWLPGFLFRIQRFFTKGIGRDAQLSLLYAIIVYFSVTGFLGAYLLTRLYLQKTFNDASQ